MNIGTRKVYQLTSKGRQAAKLTYAGFKAAQDLYISDHRILSYIPQNGLTMKEIEAKYHRDHYFFSTRGQKRKLATRVHLLVRKGYLVVRG